MGYYIRVLGKSLQQVSLDSLRKIAEPCILETDEGVGDAWEAIVLKHPSDEPIAFIEKNIVKDGELGGEEINEFIEEVKHYPPASAAEWLVNYLSDIKVIYSFQLLHGTEMNNGFEIMHKMYGAIWNIAGGILQADAEGFSNENGYTILWQFSSDVSGQWNCGVLATNGRWVNFEMDLGNQEDREAFWNGKVPPGAKLWPDQAS